MVGQLIRLKLRIIWNTVRRQTAVLVLAANPLAGIPPAARGIAAVTFATPRLPTSGITAFPSANTGWPGVLVLTTKPPPAYCPQRTASPP